MLHRHPLAEAGFEAAYHLGGEAYLRHQNKGGAPQFQAALDEFQEHQRFAAGGDAVEQRRRRLLLGHLGGKALEHTLLVVA